MLKIVIPGEPIAWARARVFFGRGKKPRFFDKQVDEKAHIRTYFHHALNNYRDGDSSHGKEHFAAGAYNVYINFYHSPPTSLPRRELNLLSWGLLPKSTRVDLDNCCKFILDAGNGLLWDDDAQVVLLCAKKSFCKNGNPRTEIEIMPVKKKPEVVKVLSEVDMKQIVDFCDDALQLRVLMYDCFGDEADNVNASAVAYWLTKIVEEHGPWIKKLDKYKGFWHHLEAKLPTPVEEKPIC